ncbi:unnamed protein product [Calicophoron daubneyi]|uniref:GT23 domain-containing protein n=1 Tax=Calicophoron daubneyi TaxID=300641 RepID=A0AAV2TQ44_CALDB
MASAQLDKINKRLKGNISSLDDNLQDMVTSLRRQLYDITLSLLVDLDGIGRVNGLAASRALDLNQLSSLIQDRIRVLQNPSDCKKAKFMLVSLNRPCAFGCNVHHLVYCFQVAYATGRTLAFDSSETSHYTSWWEQNFEPLAKNCDRDGAETVANLDNIYSNITTLKCPYIFDFDAKLEILPQAIPEDLAPALMRLHGRPSVWFMGQLLHYLMRPRPHLQEMLDRLASSYKLTGPNRSPVVGVHVRRTDKLVLEAKFHSLNEYIVHVDRYFDFIDRQRQMMARNSEWIGDIHAPSTSSASKVARQVFLATDDPSVFEDAVIYFPHHKFHGDPNRARSADVQRRTTNDSILGITLDIMLLSKADYLVCTFSSQVCRVAYELMQARHQELGDASSLAKSIDSFYYFGGEQTSYCEVIVDDEDNGIQRGTLVQMLGNNWDGFSVVKRKNQDKSFLIPSYKLQDRILVAQMGYHTLTA